MSQPCCIFLVSLARLWLLLVALASGGAAWSADMMVSAIVPGRLRLEFHEQPRMLNVQPSDVARGFVDAESPVGLSVKGSSSRGVLIDIMTSNAHVRGATVTGLAHEVIIGPNGGSLFLPGPRIDENLLLQFRFHLSRDTPPGLYPWPVHFAAAS